MVIGHTTLSEKFLFHFLHRNIPQSPGNRDSLEDIILHPPSLASFPSLPALLLQLIHNLLQFLQLLSSLNPQGDNKLEKMPIREDIHSLLTEKIIDISYIPSQEVQGMRMVVLDGLRDIDDIDLTLVEEHIVLTEIRVDQLALLIEDTHDFDHLEIDLTPLLNTRYLGVFQPRGVLHVLAYKVHDQHIRFYQETNGRDDDSLHTLQVSQLFLGPHADHLSRVTRAIPSSEPELPLNVSIPILEDQNGGFVDLDRVLFLGARVDGMVNIGLLSSREASVNFSHDFIIDQFQEYPSSSLIQNLFNGCTIGLILYPLLFCQLFLLTGVYLIVDFMEIDLRVQFRVSILVVRLESSFSLRGLGSGLTTGCL